MNIEIRKEKIEEHYEVENVVRNSFWNIYRPGCNEHLILHNFRNNKNYIDELSNIILLDDKIIGQILFSKAILTNIKTKQTVNIGTFGPVSILPEYQELGYGERLINYTLDKAKELGYKYIVIFGDPNYYKKFGFISACKLGVLVDGQEENSELDFVMIKNLENFDEINIENGPWLYIVPDGYEVDENELEEFEKKFEYKEELKEGKKL